VTEARRLYNLGRYEAAIAALGEVPPQSAVGPQARLVLGRSRLERYRQTADANELMLGRDALRGIDASRLDARDRLELLVGLGQSLYLDNDYRAAAELFTGALDQATALEPRARDQLLDWWATSLDRFAQTRPVTERPPIYDRLVGQMEQALRKEPGTASASYWLAAGLRLRGDVERAWDAALAGWVRALLTPDRGAALRPDLDELVRDGIAPERARRAAAAGTDVDQALSSLLEEWDAFKKKWGEGS
jgi:tetratricopeptide (TPR) repeat protein